jgi:hypothetical protein
MDYDDDDDNAFGNPLMKRPTWMEWASSGLIESAESGDNDRLYHFGAGNHPVHNAASPTLPPLQVAPTSPPGRTRLDSSTEDWHTPFQRARPGLVTVLRCVLAANTQICVVLICFCCTYAYIVSMSQVYNQHDIWQACLVRAGRFDDKTDLSFVQAAAALGLQVMVYSFAATGLALHALQHPALLPSAVPMVVYDLLAMLSFFSLQHIIPWPTQLEATIVTMTKYVHPGMYRNLNMAAGVCDGAYKFNQAYVLITYSCAGLVAVVLAVVVWAAHLQQLTAPSMSRFGPQLKATAWPVFLSRLALVGYVVQLLAKNASASLAVDTFQATVAPTYFPAAVPSLDPTTICLVLTSMAVKRGTLARSSSAFRLGAAAAVVYLATTWPGVVGAVSAFAQYKLFTHGGCQTFFEGQVAWGQPNAAQAEQFCTYTRASFVGELVIFVAMHAQVVACVLCFSSNRKRDLGAFNLAAPSNAQDLLFNRKSESESESCGGLRGVVPRREGFAGGGGSGSNTLSTVASSSNGSESREYEPIHDGFLSRVMSWGGSAAAPEGDGVGVATAVVPAPLPFPARAATYDAAYGSSPQAHDSAAKPGARRGGRGGSGARASQERLLTGFE